MNLTLTNAGIIFDAVDKTTLVFIPLVRTKVDWPGRSTRKQLHLKRSLWNRFRLSSSNSDWQNYNSARNHSTSMVRRDCTVYQERPADSFRRNPKAVFQHMAHYSARRAGIHGILTENGLTTTYWEATQVLTKHFAQTMFHRLSLGLDCCFFEGSLNTTTISVEMVCAKFKRLKIFISPGSDGIPARVLKHCTQV